MEMFKKLALATAISTVAITGAFAEEFTKGVVKKVNDKNGKVSIIHEEITNLDMPAMTMVFRTADEAMLESLKAGQEIEFIAERVKGKLTVVKIKE